ncbi:unnamed protein product, partial [Oppiella nova]
SYSHSSGATNHSKLSVECAAQTVHDGLYVCNARHTNTSQPNTLYTQAANVSIFTPIQINTIPENGILGENLESNGKLICRVKAYPKAAIKWEKLVGNESVAVEVDGRVVIENSENDESSQQSTLSIETVKRSDNGSYVCRANLTPGAVYGFRLAAINSMGRSEWEAMNITMQSDVPSKISEVHIFAKTNETLLIGWKRPTHDNGAQITHYSMTLRDSQDFLISNQTLDVSSGAIQTRNNYMIMFPSLIAGSHYDFQVKACSAIGCSEWSDTLDAVTADGHSDPPRNVKLKCIYDIDTNVNNGTVVWDLPDNARGVIVGYNVTFEAFSTYRNANNKKVIDQFKEAFELSANETKLNLVLKPNTNYTVRVCTINKSGCGLLSHITTSTMCETSTTTPFQMPSSIRLEKVRIDDKSDKTSRLLRVFVPRVSERNGVILCYKVIIIRLPNYPNATQALPSSPNQLNITTYSEVHSHIHSPSENADFYSVGAYVAEEYNSDNLINNIVIGDGFANQCTQDYENRSPRRMNGENESALSLSSDYIFDGSLLPNTNYTGFVELVVLGPNHTLMTKQSDYFAPIETSSLSLKAPINESSLSIFFSSLSESANGVLFGTICGLLLVLVLLLSVLCFLKRKASETSGSDDERLGLTSLIRRTVNGHRNGHIPNHMNINSIHKWVSAPIPIHKLSVVFQERHLNSDFLFQAEFESLPEKFSDRTTTASDSPENMSKNRYPDIKSYDQTRVTLNAIEGTPGSDYINADFVEGYRRRKLFICAQGPIQVITSFLLKTVNDFWRMIYEQKCRVIVMLTGIEEQGRIKCSQYWSEDQPKEISNQFRVTLKSVRKFSDYIIRRFLLEKVDGSEESRDILHFHFVMWRDFLAPEQPSWLLRFIKRVNEHYCPDMGPIVVHCSAGVGRTGTFIAIDSLMAQINDNSTHINIFECVSHLRHQRNHLVQSVKQYIFVYRAVMEYIEFGDTEVEICHLRDHYRHLKDKFDANINAIMAEFEGYDHSLSFIVTQDPMEHTVNEFWWTIAEQNVSTLVMLAELGDGQSKCHCYWPTEEFDCEFVRVKFVAEDVTQFYIKRVFDVTHKKTNDCQRVTQFQFLSWKSGVVPDSTHSLIDLMDVSLANNTQTSSPIVVHCSGGGDRSSLFVAFASLIQQIKCEERVDVFQTAQFDFLFRSLIDYIESHKLCDSGDTQL